jgi:hypothetical protein
VAGHGGATTITARGEAGRLDRRRRRRAESVGRAVGAGGVRWRLSRAARGRLGAATRGGRRGAGGRGAGVGWAAFAGGGGSCGEGRAWGGRWCRAAVGAAAPGGLKRGGERRERVKRARRAVKLHSLPSARDPALGKDFFKI